MNIEISNLYIFILGFLMAACIILRYLYAKCKRIESLKDLPRDCSGMILSGIVTSVSDGDGFRFFHVPLLRSSKYSQTDPKLKVRMAGIDAPETCYFGFPAQPLSKESKEYLSRLILYKKVQLEILSVDRYERVLAIVCIKKFCSSVNINFEMIKSGMACVYKGSDEIFGNYYQEMIDLQSQAKKDKVGIWELENMILPMDYKKMRKNNKLTVVK